MQVEVYIDDQPYQVDLVQRGTCDPSKVQILIPTFILNSTGVELIKVCVQSFLHFSPNAVDVWVIDNHSPQQFAKRLEEELDSRVNLIFNRTEPKNLYYRMGWKTRIKTIAGKIARNNHQQMLDGSYANGIGLEIGRHFLPKDVKTVFTAHSDTCATHPEWLSAYTSKLSETRPAVGGYRDKARINALHVSSLLIDYQWLLKTGEGFMPNMRQERYPNRPEYDVGDGVSWHLRQQGFSDYVLPNTQNSPELVKQIPEKHPFKHVGTSPRVFNEKGEIIFMHLGRGTTKAIGSYKQKDKFTANEWIDTMQSFLIKQV